MTEALASKLQLDEYKSTLSDQWNELVDRARCSHFMFNRGYMDYHSDRFDDASLVVSDGGKPIALFPANDVGDQVISHGGLTFGGTLTSTRMGVSRTISLLTLILSALADRGAKTLTYKAIPHIYHLVPAEEDLYALFRLGARLARRDVAAAVRLDSRLRFSKGRRWSLKHRDSGIRVQESQDFFRFMDVIAETLERHQTQATHSADEITLLASRFPSHIRLYTAMREDQMLAGVLMYETPCVAHAQYIAATAEGRACNATDCIIESLLDRYAHSHRWFDFGISTEKQGQLLNTGLAAYKESYGARSIVYDHYEVDIQQALETSASSS